MTLELLPQIFAIKKLHADSPIPEWAQRPSPFLSITRTTTELSIVCEQKFAPEEIQSNWRALRVQGNLDFSLTGVLSMIANPLAKAKVSIFAISTFDTDYILIREPERATEALREAGFTVLVS